LPTFELNAKIESVQVRDGRGCVVVHAGRARRSALRADPAPRIPIGLLIGREVPKQFDIALKHLLDAYPADWLKLVGVQPAEAVEAIDADVSTISAQADKVLLLRAPRPSLVSLDVQASYDPTLGRRALKYNVLLESRHDLPVQSVVILLRPEADGKEMRGQLDRHLPDGRRYLEFRFDVVRVWQLPLQAFLEGGLGLLPLAPLANVAQSALPSVIDQMRERLTHEADQAHAATLWTAAYVLMGLKYERGLAGKLLQGVLGMKESVTYQAIVEEGEAKGEARGKVQGECRLLLRLGTKKFGEPSAAVRKAIEGITEIDQLEQLSDRLLEAATWDELMSAR
jgi:predicted transposase YdaD